MIPNTISLLFFGAHASIPSGWTRDTDLDNVFPKGAAAATEGGDTGGSATHSHTSPAHTHTIASHVHTFGTSSYTGSAVTTAGSPAAGVGSKTHDHASGSTSSVTGGDLNDAITYQSVNHEPPHQTIIFVKPSGGVGVIKSGIGALWSGASLPSAWALCDGTGGTPDLANKYLKGANTGADSDVVSTLGALTHQHTVDHTHSAVNHSHEGTTGQANTSDIYGSSGPQTGTGHHHTHSISMSSVQLTSAAYTGTVTSGTVEPLYKKLAAIVASGGNCPIGLIGLYKGLLANVPSDWALCDGNNGTPDMRGYHLKIAANLGEIGNTGGANTHVHAASNSHTHADTTGSHTHTGTADSFAATNQVNGSGGETAPAHTHNLTSVSSTTASWGNATIQADSSNNEPPYYTVQFVMLKVKNLAGAALSLLQ